MDINDLAEKVVNQSDFVNFLKELISDFDINRSEWDNTDLRSFIRGLEGYSYDKQQVELSWRVVAEMLLAATVYE